MSNEQIGIYIKLLCSQHQHGGLIDKVTFNNLVGEHHVLRSKFVESENGFYNERLATEVEKRNTKSANMSETAKKVWNERKIQLHNKSKKEVNDKHTKVNKKDTFAMQTEIENVNENRIEIISKNELLLPFNSEVFKKTWESLLTQKKWKNKSRLALQASLKKLSGFTEAEALQMIENTIAGEWQGLFELKGNKKLEGSKTDQMISAYQESRKLLGLE